MIAQRQVWGETLVELGASDDRIVVVDGDLANSTKADLFAAAHPERFVEVGIAEQNMVGIAFGLSTLGYRPWLSTFGVFLTHRALDPIRMLVSQTGAAVRIAGAYSGLLNGRSGKTHQDVADLAIMRTMPGMTVLAPADEHEMRAAVRWAADHDGPLYLRIARDAVAPVFDIDTTWEDWAPRMLRDGGDITVVSTGVQTSRCVDAVRLLADRGIDARHIHVPMLKPLDEDRLAGLLGERVVTVEEHTMIGGLGGLVAEIVAARRSTQTVTRLGLADGWSESGPDAFLLDKYGLSASRIADRIVGVHSRPVGTPGV
ncbi:transketolase family protein [Nakamurella leprariae]|uniref:Transketolase family protein n=1 Tax=Nakamurella leprariae TaxID=2803911 RepID=A0A938YET9_9ACTN|nr:transketolase C-terminal domain-containing protein [Nakamurella leprariae]MBM9468544.1 transketolase family protein [Nakamurella leprariae]